MTDIWERKGGERAADAAARAPLLYAFVKGATCATAAWIAAWPLELLKNATQSGLALDGLDHRAGIFARGAAIFRARGIRGLYRGIGPGVSRSLVGNGVASAVFSVCSACLQTQQ